MSENNNQNNKNIQRSRPSLPLPGFSALDIDAVARPPRPPPFTGAQGANVAPQEVRGRDVPSGGEAYESWIEIFMLVKTSCLF